MQSRSVIVLGVPLADRPYWMARHVYACATPDGSVLLDLERDRYVGLGREDSLCLAAVVSGWPEPYGDGGGSQADSNGEASADNAQLCTKGSTSKEDKVLQLCVSLMEDGLLTRAGDPGYAEKRAIPIDMGADFVSVGDELEVGGCVHPRHVATFAAAYLWARYSLDWRSLLFTVEAVRAQKSERSRAKGANDVFRLAALVDVFRQIRPYFFAAEGRCLLHAVTLLQFLSRYDFYPEWVLGVTTQPWGAHTWVQWGNFLLDTNPEKIGQFTPILVV